MQVAHIQASTNQVINIDEDTNIPDAEGFYKIDITGRDDVRPSMLYIDEEFIPEPDRSDVPMSVTPLQIRRALRAIGLKPIVDSFISTLDEEIVEEWEYATSIDRYNGTLVAAAAGLGMNDTDIDNLFKLAATLG